MKEFKQIVIVCLILGIVFISYALTEVAFTEAPFGLVLGVILLLIGTHFIIAIYSSGIPKPISAYQKGTVFKMEGPVTYGDHGRKIVPLRRVSIIQSNMYVHEFEIKNLLKYGVRLVDVGHYFNGKVGDFFVYKLEKDDETDLYPIRDKLTKIDLNLTEEEKSTA